MKHGRQMMQIYVIAVILGLLIAIILFVCDGVLLTKLGDM